MDSKEQENMQLAEIEKAVRIEIIAEFGGNKVHVETSPQVARRLIRTYGDSITVDVYRFRDGETEVVLLERTKGDPITRRMNID